MRDNQKKESGVMDHHDNGKQAEERLREYERVVEGLEEMIAVVDRDYRYLIANRAFLNHRGMRRDQVIGHYVSEVLDQEIFEKIVKQKLDECFQGRVVKYELRYTYPKLGERDLLLSYFPIEGPGGVERAACILQDITEHKQAEEALRQAEQKYRDIFENAGEGIFQTTPEGRYIAANPALARMHGFDSPEELVSNLKDISREVYVDPARREEFKSLIDEHGLVRGFEHQVFRKDGSKIWVSVNARAVHDEREAIRYYEGTTQDINERKRAEARSAAFAALARKLSGAWTPLDAGRIIVQTAGDLFGWDSCDLNLYDADRDLIHHILSVDTIDGRQTDVTASISDRKPTARGRRIIDHGPELLLREEPVQFDEDAIPFGDESRPSASIMTVPIWHAARVVGLLSVQSYTPHNYDGAALDDLGALADHCGEALNRIRAEESLFESEERFRQMADHFEDVIWITDKDITKILYVNPAHEKVSGRSSESLYERLDSFVEAVHPEDRARLERNFGDKRNGDHQPFEYRIVRPDGSVRWIQSRSFPIRNNDGEVYRVAGIAQDITEHKRADEALRESEERYRDLVENSRELICTHDLDGRILSANRAATEVLGYDKKDYSGNKNLREILAPEIRDQFGTYLARIRKEGFATGLMLVQTSSGERRIWEYYNTLRSEGVATPIVRGMARDITDQKRAEEALRASEKRFRTLIENSSDAIVLLDADGMIIDHAPRTGRVMGYANESLVGRDVLEMINPEDRALVRRVLNDLLTGEGQGITLQFRALHRNGRSRWGEAKAANHLGDPEVRAIVVNYRDITERKRAEEALRESEERFRQLSDAAFEAIILHDQGTILEVNQSFCRMYGYERAEVIGKSVLDLALPAFREQFRQTVRSGDTDSYEGPALRKDGTTFRAEVAGKPIHYQGRVVRVAAIRDITEQKRNERRQAAQYAVTRVLAESATLAEATPQLLQVICESLRWKVGEFWRVGDSTNLLRCVETWHVPALDATSFIEASRQTELTPDAGLPGRVWQSGQPAWIPDVMTDPGFARAAIAAKVGLRGAVAFPILLGNHTLGVMQFFSRRTPEVDEDLLQIMSAISSQIGQFTERKRAEEALRQSEVYFRSLIEHAADTISTYDANGVRLYTSPSIERVLGYKPEEMIGRSGFELLHPDDRPFLSSLFAQAVQIPGTTVTKELRCQHKDGTWRTLESTGSNLLGIPEVGAVVLNSRDITERRRAEEALRESEERYRDLVENSQEFICTHDLDGLILSGNRAAVEVMGYDPKDYYKRNLRELLVPEVRDQFDDYLTRIRRDGVASGLMLVQTSSGERRVWEYHNTVRTEGVAAPIVRSMARDITERRRVEKAMSDLRRELEMTMNSMGEGVHRVDLKGNIVFENPAAARMLGWEVAELLGKHSHSTMHHTRQDGTPYPTEECPIYATFRDGVSRHVADEVFWRRDGTSFPVEYMTAQMRNDRNEIVAAVVTFRDITERKQIEAALRGKSEELDRYFNDSLDLLCIAGTDGYFRRLNPEWERTLGYSLAELEGRRFLDFVHPDDVAATLAAMRKLSSQEYVLNFINRYRHRDGSYRWIEWRSYPADDVIYAVARDITERKRVEEALRKQNEYLAALHETALGLINHLDLDELLEDIVTRACALVDIPGGHLYLIEPGGTEMRVRVGVGVSRDFVGALISKGQGVAGTIWQTRQPLVVDDYRNWEHRLTHAGYDVLRLVGAVPLRSGSQVVGVLGVESTEDGQGLGEHQIEILNRFAQLASIALDNAHLHSAMQQELAERKRVEEALLASEYLLRESQRIAGLGSYVLDIPTGLWRSSDVLDGVFGIDETYERSVEGWAALIHPDDCTMMVDYFRNEVLDQGLSFDKEYRIIRADNRAERWVHGLGSLEFDALGHPLKMPGTIQDITERKRIEDALRESEERYRTLFETAPDGIGVFDPQMKLMIINRRALEIFGYESVAEVVGLSAYDLVAPQNRSRARQNARKIIETGQMPPTESIGVKKDGTHFATEFSAALIRDSEGQPSVILGVTRDITERKRAEEALRLRESYLSAILENQPGLVWLKDVDGRFLTVNQAFADSCGKASPAELASKTDLDIWPKELAEKYRADDARIIKDQASLIVEEPIFDRGKTTWFETFKTPILDDQGDVIGSTGYSRDITERKHAEKALRESEERYRELFENAKDAIYVHDLSGRYTSVNHAAEKLSGFTREEILGKHFSNFVSPRDLKHVRINLCRKLDEENETIYEVDLVTRTGQRVPVEVSSRLIYESGVAVGIQGTARDITDRKRAQEALRIYSQRLIQVQEAERENIARELHDEIGQVLTAVKINLQSVQHTCQTADCVPRLNESIGIVDEALGRVRELSIELRPSLLDDLGLTAALRWYVDRYAQRTGIIAEVLNSSKEDGRLPRELETACFRIAQEALTNVARHARAGSVSVQLERSRERMLLTVMDDGVGFDIDKLRKSASAASALGLRGMEERALAVGGHIEIDSGLERGTRVRATFPLKRK